MRAKKLLLFIQLFVFGFQISGQNSFDDFTLVDTKNVDTYLDCSKDAYIFSKLYGRQRDIPSDENERLHVVQLLKAKDFTIKDRGRGNWNEGPRFVQIVMESDSCKCTVIKYYKSIRFGRYKVFETLECEVK